MHCNKPIPFDETLLEDCYVECSQAILRAKNIILRGHVNKEEEPIWALKALTLTDLTTLAGDDTKSNVARLCQRAANPFTLNTLSKIDSNIRPNIHAAAVCVYPARVSDAFDSLKCLKKLNVIQIAAVATGFPTGQYPLISKLQEIEYAISKGATEIDIVIDRNLALNENWEKLYNELVEMRKICSNKAHMKTILAVGELGTMTNVKKASMVAMMAGSDFIKTSTGKESVNATLPVSLVMIEAIQKFHRKTGIKIGFKPAGGIKSVRDAINWMILVKETLGMEWLNPNLFRFGASSLFDDIEKCILSAFEC
ncbi:deoxyribose-phosphate aldolase [Condylostylus longicornis]|uniref:deoxyribose-phosphate aldolase n=1 Tax=Condylostylus longicornis TaxID=2530218 RepID=UPI00244DE4D1|nr:deoxyribose-phosphate aldolase [Condylostylus longicornis]